MTAPIDLFSIYMPDFEAVTPEHAERARTRLVKYIELKWPDIDTRPGSVFGDTFISQAAYIIAALEIAMGRFMSDLDLENVSKNIIYNCDFVRRYLDNFAVAPRETLKSAGVVRLNFVKDEHVSIDRSFRMKFGNDIFEPRLPHPGGLEILRVGEPTPPGQVNTARLIRVGNSYYADIAVIGTMTERVKAQASGSVNFQPPNLNGVIALYDFEFGTPPQSLPELAKLTRRTAYSASLNTRGGAENFVLLEFPDVTHVSAVLPGDNEAVRDTVNPLGIASGKLDVYVRSSGFGFRNVQRLRLNYNPATDRFASKIIFNHPPILIDDIRYEGNPTINLKKTNDSCVLFSKSSDFAKAPMALCAYSKYEQFWLSIKMPRDENTGSPLIQTEVTHDGEQYADFVIAYRTDPMLIPITEAIESGDVKPAGVEVLVRGFVPIVFQSMNIKYARRPGTMVNLTAAREEILKHVRSAGYPVNFNEAAIADTMMYAGASNLLAIEVQAFVRWTAADKILKLNSPDPVTNFTGAIADALTPHSVEIVSASAMTPEYVDPFIGTPNATYEVCGSRNVVYILDDAKLTFEEVQVPR